MLTLDQTTLYYRNLSNAYVKENYSGLTDEVNAWALQVPRGSKAKSKMSVRSVSTPSLTNASSSCPPRSSGSARPAARPIARSALTNSVKVKNTDSDDEVQIVQDTGFISDQDETMGEERDAAVKSPPKAGRRVSSSASPYKIIVFIYLTSFLMLDHCQT